MKTYVTLLILSALTLAVNTSYAAQETYMTQGKVINKLEALKLMLTDSAAQVTRCVDVTLSEKGTIVVKKQIKPVK